MLITNIKSYLGVIMQKQQRQAFQVQESGAKTESKMAPKYSHKQIQQGFFLAICPKTQGRKNSNSRKISQKLKEFFPRKLKKPPNRGKFWANFDQKLKFQAKNRHFWRKNGKFSKNSRIFRKLKPQISQKLKKSTNPQILSSQKNG